MCDDLRGEHLVDEVHEDGAHLLDDFLEPAEALGLRGVGGLFAPAEDVLGFAVALATGRESGFVDRGRAGGRRATASFGR